MTYYVSSGTLNLTKPNHLDSYKSVTDAASHSDIAPFGAI